MDIEPKIEGLELQSYSKLLRLLFNTPFYSDDPRDDARIDDIYSMRAQYRVFDMPFDSVNLLELLVYISVKMGSMIGTMSDADIVNHTFANMISSLGLLDQTNEHFNHAYCCHRINDWLCKRYSHDGVGGLFYVEQSPIDMRLASIWDQWQCFINANY